MTGQGVLGWFKNEFRSRRLLSGLTSGTLIGVKEVIFAVSVGSLLFGGELTPYLAYGLGIALITQLVMLIGISLGSSVAGVLGGVQDSPSVILAVILSALFVLPGSSGTRDALPTVLVAVAATTLLTGVFFLALGIFRLGGLVRFIPYPVVGGFLAGTGWLLVQGSFGVMADLPLTWSNAAALVHPEQLVLWVPGVILALVLLFGLRRVTHSLAMPACLVGALVLFYAALLVTGTTPEAAAQQGLVLGEVSGEAIWQPLAAGNLVAANWTAILGQGGNIAIILVLSVVSLLLNASGIELVIRQDVDLNRELRVAGLVNIVSGLGGGAVGYHALDLSTLCCRIGARGRLPGLVAGAICAVMLVAGAPLLALFPRFILGGLLLFLGLDFLVDWLVDGWSRLSWADYGVVVLILVVIATTNFLLGVGVGLVAMVILFVVNYSRIGVVQYALSGAEIKSNVERCAYHRQALREVGPQIYILKLQGYLFFGTANALLEQIRARVSNPDQVKVRFIVLDFRRVSGLDSSAVISFVKARQLAESQGTTLLLTSVPQALEQQFRASGLLEAGEVVRIFPDLDRGLEWCEDRLLRLELITQTMLPLTLAAQLGQSGFERRDTDCLLRFLDRVEVQEGEPLIRQGDEADDLYFVERGNVSVYLELEAGKQVRLQTLGPGTIVGELGFYLETARTASVIADAPTVAYRLSRAALVEMKAHEPELAAAFHELVVRLLAERLVATDQALEAVLK